MPQMYSLKWGKDRNGKQKFQPDPKRFLFNVDTLWYTYDASNYDEIMKEGLADRLIHGKEVAEETGELDYIQVLLDRYDYPVTFEIQSSGQRPIYAYQIRNYDMAFYFAKRRRNDGTYPIKVQVNQFKLWEMGVHDAFLESLQVLTELGFIYENAKSSRIDLCVHSDQFQWTLADLQKLDYPRNIADTNKPNFWHLDPMTGEFETVYYGDRSRLELRIYNKSIEIVDKKKDYFREIYESNGMNPEKVWNVEFELHRDYLKDFADAETGETNIFDSMDYLLRFDGLSKLWTHLTQSKFVHDSAFWKVLQQGDMNKFVSCKNFIFRLKDIDTSKEREVAQIRGRLQKLIVNEELPEDADMMIESIKAFTTMVYEYEEDKEKDFREDVYRKRKQYMDVEMLKLALAERRKVVDPLVRLNELLHKRKSI
jgi:hypothetical protein